MAAIKKIGAQSMRQKECVNALLPVRDALAVLSGSWKLPILITLLDSPKRFKQISKEIDGITDKMLSKELKELEANKLVVRSVYDTFPPTVEYAGTDHAESLRPVIFALRDWGLIHRKKVIGK